jgi:hypothetical protein
MLVRCQPRHCERQVWPGGPECGSRQGQDASVRDAAGIRGPVDGELRSDRAVDAVARDNQMRRSSGPIGEGDEDRRAAICRIAREQLFSHKGVYICL